MGEIIGIDTVEQKRWERLLGCLAETLDRVRACCETDLATYTILAGPIGYRSDYPETAAAIAGTLAYIDARRQLLATGTPSTGAPSADAVAEARRLLDDLRANEPRWATLFREERDRIHALRTTPPRGFGGTG